MHKAGKIRISSRSLFRVIMAPVTGLVIKAILLPEYGRRLPPKRIFMASFVPEKTGQLKLQHLE
jgi:hypothetical protein